MERETFHYLPVGNPAADDQRETGTEYSTAGGETIGGVEGGEA